MLASRKHLLATAASIALVGVALSGSPASATPLLTLQLSETGYTTSTTTGTGAINYIGTYGSFGLNFTALTNPFTSIQGTGAPNIPSPNLNLVTNQVNSLGANPNTGAGGIITIALTETNITSPIGTLPFTTALTWNVAGAITVVDSAYINPNGAAFGTTTLLGTQSQTHTGPNSLAGSDNIPSTEASGAGPYSLTEIITLTANNTSGCSSANCNWLNGDTISVFATVPEPTSLALMGSGLLAFGAWRRRRKAS